MWCGPWQCNWGPPQPGLLNPERLRKARCRLYRGRLFQEGTNGYLFCRMFVAALESCTFLHRSNLNNLVNRLQKEGLNYIWFQTNIFSEFRRVWHWLWWQCVRISYTIRIFVQSYAKLLAIFSWGMGYKLDKLINLENIIYLPIFRIRGYPVRDARAILW